MSIDLDVLWPIFERAATLEVANQVNLPCKGIRVQKIWQMRQRGEGYRPSQPR
jgi:hypothetical protein